MARNLDMTALRSFVTVADAGGVTKAAGILNLTQSAVSMQLKRLEEGLGLDLLDRSARQIGRAPRYHRPIHSAGFTPVCGRFSADENQAGVRANKTSARNVRPR